MTETGTPGPSRASQPAEPAAEARIDADLAPFLDAARDITSADGAVLGATFEARLFADADEARAGPQAVAPEIETADGQGWLARLVAALRDGRQPWPFLGAAGGLIACGLVGIWVGYAPSAPVAPLVTPLIETGISGGLARAATFGGLGGEAGLGAGGLLISYGVEIGDV